MSSVDHIFLNYPSSLRFSGLLDCSLNMSKIPNQKTLPTVWDLSPLIPGDGSEIAFDADLARSKATASDFAARWRERDDYLTQSKILAQALEEYEKLERDSSEDKGEVGGRASPYAFLASQQDMRDTVTRARLARAEKVTQEIGNDLLFFTHRLARVSAAVQKSFLTTPELEPYRHLLERLFAEARYLLPEGGGKIKNLYSGPARGDWGRLGEEILAREERMVLISIGQKEEVKSFAGLLGLLESPEQVVRDHAALALDDIFRTHVDTAEAELNAILTTKRVDDDLRQVTRPDLLRHLADDIDSQVVDTLISTVAERFDLSRRYYKLKAKLLGKDRLAFHDRVAPIGELPRDWKYPKAVAVVAEVLDNLDGEFSKIFDSFT